MTQPEKSAASMYLNLLKRVLTNTLFLTEPDANQEDVNRFVVEHVAHYQNTNAISMIPIVRFDNLEMAINTVIDEKIDGDFIETGVWRGGATIFMRAALKVRGNNSRSVWVADSFEGLPKPDKEKFPREAASFASSAMTKYYNHLAVSIEEVKQNFETFGLLDENVKFLKGWFKDTLPTAPIESLAILRLDGDYYESTMDALVNLYDKVSPGGFVIVDDYGEDAWTYCRKAVDDFRRERDIQSPLIRVDRPCSYWRKL